MGNSAQVAPLLSTREGRLSSSLPRWQATVLLLLIAWLYVSILARLVLQWVGPSHDPTFEHGIFVPLFSFFILWQGRKKLNAIAPTPSWTGLPLVVLSLLMLVLGVLGAELFFSRVSLLVLLGTHGVLDLTQAGSTIAVTLIGWGVFTLYMWIHGCPAIS